jgi:NAD(P)-dependent dehydrogenase (short-subunit alcohol dehydrogenase family)
VLVVGAGTQSTHDPHATAGLVEGEKARAVVLVGDASDPEASQDLVEQANETLGGLDGLVLNVGTGKGSGLRATSAEDWDATFAIDVRSHFLACKAAVPLMGEGGSIVFIGSVAGLKPGSHIPAYDSAKAALTGLCRHVAAEGARHQIRADLVAPGLIDTPLGRRASAGRPSRQSTPVPLGRQGTARIRHATQRRSSNALVGTPSPDVTRQVSAPST